VRGLLRGVHAHEVAALRAGTTFAAATTLVLTATGRALLARRFRRRGLDRGVEGTTRVARLAALSPLTLAALAAAATSAAASTPIAAALALTLLALTLLTLALTSLTLARRCRRVRRRSRARSGVANLWCGTGIADAGARR
jgi:hypothetical protein